MCKKQHQLLGLGINFNKTVNGSEGSLTTPNYPGHYYPNLDYNINIMGPDRTRIIIRFQKIDIEYQQECLYDYVELRSIYKMGVPVFNDVVRLCGSHYKDMNRFDFVSETSEAEIKFHSDYSLSGNGFSLTWHAVDVSACPLQTLTAKEGTLTSPNYPYFLLSHLDCTITILAPSGKRIWLDFFREHLPTPDVTRDYTIELTLGKRARVLKPFETETLLTEGSFVSSDERLSIKLQTGDHPRGPGFKANYKITDPVQEEKIIMLSNITTGLLLHVNYPDSPPANVDFLQHFIAPLGYVILLEIHNVKLSDKGCSEDDGFIDVYDTYADTNGTVWKLCYDIDSEEALIPTTPIYISSFLNTLHVRQKNGVIGIPLNCTLRVQLDESFKNKLVTYKEKQVESCTPNPCNNGGKCIEKKNKKFCQCTSHYTGK